MNDKVLLAKCISLLFRESVLNIKEINSADLVRTALEFVKLAEVDISINGDTTVMSNMKKTALRMCDTVGTPIDPVELVQDLRIDCGTDEATFSALRESIETITEEKGLKISVSAVSRQIQNYFRDKKAEEILSKAYQTMKFQRSKVTSMRAFIANLCSELEPYTEAVTTADPAVICSYDLTDANATARAFEKMDDVSSGKALMRSSLQGINDMFGGGWRRGMTGVVYGMGHHYKSGKVIELFRDFCMYNTPYMKDPTKKPCNVFITFENEAEGNIDFLYKIIRENETGVAVEEQPSVSAIERSEYLKAKLGQMGYHPKIERIQEGGWGYRDICNYVLKLEAQGYEVHSIVIDYLSLANKSGCASGMIGVDVQDLFKKIRGFMAVRDILCISPHQLNSEVKMLKRDCDEAEIVKKLPGAGYSYNCKTLENELDFELFLYLVKDVRKGKYFLTFQRGKHRVNNPAPIDKHYTCYESHDVGRLRPDIDGPSMALKRPGDRPAHMGQANHAADFFSQGPSGNTSGGNVVDMFS